MFRADASPDAAHYSCNERPGDGFHRCSILCICPLDCLHGYFLGSQIPLNGSSQSLGMVSPISDLSFALRTSCSTSLESFVAVNDHELSAKDHPGHISCATWNASAIVSFGNALQIVLIKSSSIIVILQFTALQTTATHVKNSPAPCQQSFITRLQIESNFEKSQPVSG